MLLLLFLLATFSFFFSLLLVAVVACYQLTRFDVVHVLFRNGHKQGETVTQRAIDWEHTLNLKSANERFLYVTDINGARNVALELAVGLCHCTAERQSDKLLFLLLSLPPSLPTYLPFLSPSVSLGRPMGCIARWKHVCTRSKNMNVLYRSVVAAILALCPVDGCTEDVLSLLCFVRRMFFVLVDLAWSSFVTAIHKQQVQYVMIPYKRLIVGALCACTRHPLYFHGLFVGFLLCGDTLDCGFPSLLLGICLVTSRPFPQLLTRPQNKMQVG